MKIKLVILFFFIIQQVNGGNEGGCISATEWEAFKQEMMREMRQQFTQMKKDILDGKI